MGSEYHYYFFRMKRSRSAPKNYRVTKRPKQSIALKKAILRTKTDEVKNIDVATANTIVFASSLPVVTLINGVDEGNTSTTRIGRKIIITSLAWRWCGFLAPTTTGASGLRLLIVRDAQSNGAAPTATDILSTGGIDSPMNLDNSKRFKILTDHVISCVGTQGPQAWNEKGFIQLEKPSKGKAGLETIFNSNSTATITSINSGGIFALTLQNGGLLVANPTSSLYTRLRFIDA